MVAGRSSVGGRKSVVWGCKKARCCSICKDCGAKKRAWTRMKGDAVKRSEAGWGFSGMVLRSKGVDIDRLLDVDLT